MQDDSSSSWTMLALGNVTDDYDELADIFNFSPPPASLVEFRIAATIVYGTLALLGVIANLIFCVVIWRTEKLHTVTHMLMTNLAVSNLLFLLFHPPYFLSTYILETNWQFGLVICKASFSIAYVTVTGSFYFMCLVAIDRWLAIFRRKERIDRRRGMQLTVGAWIVAGIVAFPYMFNSTVLDMNTGISVVLEKTTRCGCKAFSWDRELLTITFLVQYGIPLMIMVPAYSHLAFFLWKRPTVGVQTKEKSKKAHARRKRLIFTLIGILVIQILCWSPLFSVGILHRINPTHSLLPYIITSMIALLGVLFTPLCYLTNDGFSQQVCLMFPCLKRKRRDGSGTERQLLGAETDMALMNSSMVQGSPVGTPRLQVVAHLSQESMLQL